MRSSNSSRGARHHLYEWVFRVSVLQKLNNPVGYALFFLMAVVVAYAVASRGLVAGALLLGAIYGLPILALCLSNSKAGFLITLFFSSFIFLINRILGQELPLGVAREVLFLAIFLGIYVRKSAFNDKVINPAKNPITLLVFLWTLYLLVQAFNPNGVWDAWLFGARGIIGFAITYAVLVYVFDSLDFVSLFTKFWLFIALLAALYGLYQEYVGLPSYDLKWVTSNELRIGLNFIQGRWRKWSFMSDIAVFGLFMAYAGIVCFVLTLGPFHYKKKLLLFLSGCLMFLAMIYSGNRTAFAIVPVGFFFYVIMTLKQTRTLLIGAAALLVFVGILFGPVYNPTINRLRSSFFPGDDPSMNVRDINRARIQPYIYHHPIGGGLNTSGILGDRFAPGHQLAGFPPDSGYLETALEVGWVGLIIQFATYITIMLVGITNYRRAKNPKVKIYYLAYLSGFFALTISLYAKKAVFQLPLGLIFYAVFALVSRMIEFDDTPEKVRSKDTVPNLDRLPVRTGE